MSLEARRLSPIYEAIDSGAFKNAIQACNKILKKQPKSSIAKTLKSLALLRMQKLDEAIVLCDEVFATQPTDENVLLALSQVLRHLERHADIITLYETAFKKEPRNEEVGSQAFMAMVRVGSWKTAQQTSHKLSRAFPDDHRYLTWSVMCATLQACDPETDEKTKSMLLTLALRLFQQLPAPSGHAASPDKLCLLLEIYLSFAEPKLLEAFEILSSDSGRAMIESSLAVDERRRLIWSKLGKFTEELDLSVARLERGDRNWLTFIAYLDSVFSLIANAKESGSTLDLIRSALRLLNSLAIKDGRKERGSHLSRLELEKRLRALPSEALGADVNLEGREPLRILLQRYFEDFGDKACCFEDLTPYVGEISEDEAREWTEFLEHKKSDISPPSLLSALSAWKLLRYSQTAPPQSEHAEGIKLFQMYLEATRLSPKRDPDELDPADGLALLAANCFISEWSASERKSLASLHCAILCLEYASGRSIHNYQFRLLLIRIYRLLGAHSLVEAHYRLLKTRTLQHDTLSHFIMERATTWCIVNDGQMNMIREALDAGQIYQDNLLDTPDMLTKALLHEKYSQIPTFIEFEDRLDRSLQRDLIKIDHVRMRFVVEPPTTETLTLEIGELDYMFFAGKVHHDNRDYSVLPNFQRKGQSIDEQTRLAARPGVKWCDIFIQIYIRLLNRAAEPDFHSPYLFQFSSEDLAELTPSEKVFVKYAEVLSQWLWPAEKPRPGNSGGSGDVEDKYNVQPEGSCHGTRTNGDANDGLQGSTMTHAPYIVLLESERDGEAAVACVTELYAHLKIVISGGGLPWEALHSVSLMQEALVILNIHAMPFAPNVNGKHRKADPLWTAIKPVRSKLTTMIHEASVDLKAYADMCDSAGSRAAFLGNCGELVKGDDEVGRFVETLHLGKAQYAMLASMSRGITKIADGKRPMIEGFATTTTA